MIFLYHFDIIIRHSTRGFVKANEAVLDLKSFIRYHSTIFNQWDEHFEMQWVKYCQRDAQRVHSM